MNNELILKNLHHVFVPIGILFGFLLFAVAAVGNPVAGFLAYLFFYLPAFFGGVYSGEERADDSDMLDVLAEMANNMFKFDLDYDLLNMTPRINQILAITITLFYFAFWMILGISLDLPVVGLIFKWIVPSYLFGLLSNKDILKYVISFVQKNEQKLKRIL